MGAGAQVKHGAQWQEKPRQPPSQEDHCLYSPDQSITSTASQQPYPKNRAVICFEGRKVEGKRGFRGQHQRVPPYP